jgi:hypothetical protein
VLVSSFLSLCVHSNISANLSLAIIFFRPAHSFPAAVFSLRRPRCPPVWLSNLPPSRKFSLGIATTGLVALRRDPTCGYVLKRFLALLWLFVGVDLVALFLSLLYAEICFRSLSLSVRPRSSPSTRSRAAGPASETKSHAASRCGRGRGTRR